MGTLSSLQDQIEDLSTHIKDMNEHLKWALSLIPCEEEEYKEKWEKAKACLRYGSAKKIRIHTISYDLDFDDADGEDLPKEMEMEVEAFMGDDAVGESAGEFISDSTGYCHNGFKWDYID